MLKLVHAGGSTSVSGTDAGIGTGTGAVIETEIETGIVTATEHRAIEGLWFRRCRYTFPHHIEEEYNLHRCRCHHIGT